MKSRKPKSTKTVAAPIKMIHLPKKVMEQGGILFVLVGTDDRPASDDEITAVTDGLRKVISPDAKLNALVMAHGVDFRIGPKVNSVASLTHKSK
jgi:hypothetical protein